MDSWPDDLRQCGATTHEDHSSLDQQAWRRMNITVIDRWRNVTVKNVQLRRSADAVDPVCIRPDVDITILKRQRWHLKYNGISRQTHSSLRSDVHCEPKNCTILFLQNLCHTLILFYIEIITYSNEAGTKWHQDHQSIWKSIFIMPNETQHTYTCPNQRQFLHVSLNFINLSSRTLK